MKTNTALICASLLFILLMAQRATAQYIIEGTITNEQGKPVTAATCLLAKNNDTSKHWQVLSDGNGKFLIDLAEKGSYALMISANNYKNVTKQVIVSDTKTRLLVTLQTNRELAGITVNARKPLIEQRADRTIFNVENSIAANGGDALEALKKTPGVLIVNNQVTIAGKDAVSVMLNGRLQQVSGEDLVQLLRTIPAGNLSKIEVITTPPARYDAEGNAGIINLITKKVTQQGLRGNAIASYNRNTYNSGSLSTGLNYRRDKLNISLNLLGNREAYLYTNRGTSYYPDQQLYQKIDQGLFYRNGKVQVGADYTLGKKNIVSFSYTAHTTAISTEETIITDAYNKHLQLDSIARTIGTSDEPANQKQTLNLNYEWQIDTNGHKLNIDADYYTQQSTKTRQFSVKHVYPDNNPTGYKSNNRASASPSLIIKSIKADLQLPVNVVNLTVGIKAAVVNNRVENLFEQEIGSEYVPDPSQTNTFEYTEQTQAAYISAQKTINSKFDIQVGLRAEHTNTQGYSPTTLGTVTNDYTKLFPTAYIQYKPKDDHVLILSYSRRINRPGYNTLNPFRYYYSLNSYTVGNPELQPSFNNNLRFTYTLKSKYTFVVYTNYVNNYWDRIAQVNADETAVGFTRANLGRAWFTGASAEASLTPAKWWELHASINAFYADYKLNYNGNRHFIGINAYGDCSSSFVLNKKKNLFFEINGYYHAPRQKDFKYWEEMSSISMGFKALFLEKNLILSINADDLMAKTYWYQTNSVNGTTEYSYDDERGLRIAATYKFGNKSVKGRRERMAAEEMNRIN